MTIYLATYNWQGSDQWATYGLYEGELRAVHDKAIPPTSDLDLVDLKPLEGDELEQWLASGYEVKVVE